MPKFDKHRITHRMAELGVNSETLANRTGIPWGSLRNAIAGTDPLNLARVYDIGRVLRKDGEELRDVVADLLANNDGVPEPPPDQTKPKPKPERRKETGGSGPRRESDVAGAA